jgi:hypothetical protein
MLKIGAALTEFSDAVAFFSDDEGETVCRHETTGVRSGLQR